MVQTLLSISAISWSILLIYAAATKSPAVMRPCVIMIVIKCVTDIIAAVTSYIVSERIISNGQTVFLISEGPCKSHLFCFSSHLFLMSLYQQNLVWLISSYLFRYYILNYHDPPLFTFIITALLAFSPWFINSVYWILKYLIWDSISEQHASRRFSTPEDLVIGGLVVHESILISGLILFILSVSAIFVYLWIRYTLVKFLKVNTSRLSKTAIILNTQLVKIIHFQSLIPIFTILAIFTLILIHYYIIDPFRIQCLPSALLSSTLSIYPFGYVVFMPPYFNFCLGNPKKEATRFFKSKLKLNSNVGQSSTVVYPLSTF